MSTPRLLAYIAVMAVVTYLIRAVPLAALRRKIRSPFVRSFLYYIPFAVLAAMVFPAVFTATASPWSALAGLIVAVALALCERSLLTVAVAACTAVFIAEWVLGFV